MTGTVIDSLIVSLGLDGSNFNKGTEQALGAQRKFVEATGKNLKSVEAGTKNTALSFSAASEAALGFFAVLAGGRTMQALMADTIKADAAIGRLSYNLDISAQKLATWENAARAAGSSGASMDSALSGLSQGMTSMNRGQSTPLQGVLNQLHLAYQDANGKDKDPTELFLEIAGKLSAMDPKQAAYLGNALGFDPTITSFAELGQGGIQKLLAENQSSVTAQSIQAAKDLNEKFGELLTTADNVSTDLMTKFEPQLSGFAKTLDDFAKNFEQSGLYKTLAWLNQPATTLNSVSSTVDGWGKDVHSFLEWPSSSSNPLPGGPPPTADQKAIRDEGVAYFVGQGWTVDQARGLMANVQAESSYNPSAVSPDGGAHGLFQWRGDRWARLVAQYGPNPTAAQQFAFAQQELTTTEAPAGAALRATTNAFGAGVAVDTAFERSGDTWVGQAYRGGVAQGVPIPTGAAQGTPQGVPPRALAILNHIRAQKAAVNNNSKNANVSVVNNIQIDAKAADAKGIASQIGKTTASTITAARANTGVN